MKKTALYEKHLQAGAKMVEFAGWQMPLQYAGVIKEHSSVREHAGLFDVSHMGEISVTGPDAREFVNWTVTNDVSGMKQGDIIYSLLLNEDGGTIDDLLVYCLGDEDFLLIVNASNADKDFEWLKSLSSEEEVVVENVSDKYSLLALQGPKSAEILRKVLPFPEDLKYYGFTDTMFEGVPVTLSRTGYTGEDGFEILISEKAELLWETLIETGKEAELAPCGLAVRDLLRIEAGYPLYGHELTEEIDPRSAGLKWAVKKGETEYVGKTAVDAVKPHKKRIGFEVDGRAVPREGFNIFIGEEQAGIVTSGTFSPSLQKPIGIGYISRTGKDLLSIGDSISVEIRGKKVPAKIIKMPFINTGVFRQ